MVKRKNWTRAQLDEALSEIRLGKSVHSVSKRFNIPRTTLMTKKNGTVSLDATFGPAPILTLKDENDIIEWIQLCNRRGFPVTKNQVIMSVAQIIKIQKRKTPFKNGIPGRHWYNAFLRRHPEVGDHIAPNSVTKSHPITEKILRQWFTEVGKHLTTLNLSNIDPSRIFNCDESAFYLTPSEDRALVRKREKALHNFTINDEKECLATFFMINAAGSMAPPMVILPCERVPLTIGLNFPKGWSIGRTENGWMTGESFANYLVDVFEPWLEKENIQRPVILYVEGRSSYLTMPVVEFCMTKEIQLIALHANATQLIQPLDVALFSPLKEMWKNNVQAWRVAKKRKARRKDFAELLIASVEKLDVSESIKTGFSVCGLYPFDPDAVQYDKLLRTIKEPAKMVTTKSKDNEGEMREARDALRMLEKFMDEALVKSFKDCQIKGVWDGDVEQSGLFSLWLKLVNKSNV